MAEGTAAVREKVQRIMADWRGTVEIDRDGDFTVPFESTRVFIRIIDQEDRTLVQVLAPILRDVPATPELFKALALEGGSFFFGAYEVYEDEGLVRFGASHTLLGDFLDPDELKQTVVAIANMANDRDDELQQQFGGKRFTDD